MLVRTLTITLLYNDAGVNEHVNMAILDNGQPVQNLPNVQALALAGALSHYSTELINAAAEGIVREESARQAIAAQEALEVIKNEAPEGGNAPEDGKAPEDGPHNVEPQIERINQMRRGRKIKHQP